MRLFQKISFLLIAMVLYSCSNNESNKSSETLPLQPVYDYFDQINQTKYMFENLNNKLNASKLKDNSNESNQITKDFGKSQSECIKDLETKFPVGSVQFPFEQNGSKDTVKITSVYLSGFSFPWSTATTICFYFTIEYKYNQGDIMFKSVPLKFFDNEGDVIYIRNIPANKEGKTRITVKAQIEFRKFAKIVIG